MFPIHLLAKMNRFFGRNLILGECRFTESVERETRAHEKLHDYLGDVLKVGRVSKHSGGSQWSIACPDSITPLLIDRSIGEVPLMVIQLIDGNAIMCTDWAGGLWIHCEKSRPTLADDMCRAVFVFPKLSSESLLYSGLSGGSDNFIDVILRRLESQCALKNISYVSNRGDAIRELFTWKSNTILGLRVGTASKGTTNLNVAIRQRFHSFVDDSIFEVLMVKEDISEVAYILSDPSDVDDCFKI
jgi:hypothetical protein